MDDAKLQAGIKFLRRTGAREVQIRYSDDEQPIVWMALARYGVDLAGHPQASGGEDVLQVDAAFDPLRAVLRLCERVADGGECAHCHRPTGVEPDSLETMPLDNAICWWQYDPELQVFRRGCEGR